MEKIMNVKKDIAELFENLSQTGHDLNQGELAQILNVDDATITRWMKGSTPRGENFVNLCWLTTYSNPEKFELEGARVPQNTVVRKKGEEFRQIIERKNVFALGSIYENSNLPMCQYVYQLNKIGKETDNWNFVLTTVNNIIETNENLDDREYYSLYNIRALSRWKCYGTAMPSAEAQKSFEDIDVAVSYVKDPDLVSLSEQNKWLIIRDTVTSENQENLDEAMKVLKKQWDRKISTRMKYFTAANIICVASLLQDDETIKEMISKLENLEPRTEQEASWKEEIRVHLLDRDPDTAYLRKRKNKTMFNALKKALSTRKSKVKSITAGVIAILFLTLFFFGNSAQTQAEYTELHKEKTSVTLTAGLEGLGERQRKANVVLAIGLEGLGKTIG
jgi:hypothetical protein